MDTKLAHKAVKAARLALSEEMGSQNSPVNEDAARMSGRMAGELAAKAGMTLTQLDEESKLSKAAYAWDAAVDAWYELQPKDVTGAEVELLTAQLSNAEHRDLVTRMWAELQRRRGV